MTETEQISGASALNSTLALLVTRDIFSEVWLSYSLVIKHRLNVLNVLAFGTIKGVTVESNSSPQDDMEMVLRM
jgi:hypothetical protein